jgi:hypothetical protein
MKKFLFYLNLSAMVTFFMSSCQSEKDESHVSYGVIKNVVSEKNYEILTDKGNTLIVTHSNSGQEIVDDKRVLVSYDIKSDKESSKKIYEVGVNGFYNLLSKPLVRESFILENEDFRRDSIGDTPYNSIYTWFGGDYININFEIYYNRHSSVKHLINLVYDDTRDVADTIYLSLYHNAYDEQSKYGSDWQRGLGRCSFKIADLLPDDVNSKPVKLSWREYGHGFDVIERSDSGVFTKGSYSESESSILKSEFDNSLTVE